MVATDTNDRPKNPVTIHHATSYQGLPINDFHQSQESSIVSITN